MPVLGCRLNRLIFNRTEYGVDDELYRQVVESMHPADGLSYDDQRRLCHLALPDSNCGQNLDVQFSFRLRQGSLPLHSMSPLEHSYLYAAAFFRQTRDGVSDRGYIQKSVVAVSSQPYTRLLSECVRIIGPLFFEYGSAVLDKILSSIEKWPSPVPGETVHLPLAGTFLQYSVPKVGLDLSREVRLMRRDSVLVGKESPRDDGRPHSSPPDENVEAKKEEYPHVLSDSDTSTSNEEEDPALRSDMSRHLSPGIIAKAIPENATKDGTVESTGPVGGSSLRVDIAGQIFGEENLGCSRLFQEISLFSTFGGLSIALWHIWELAIVGEPILVLAPTPDKCSQAVLAIASLISPIVYNSDYRPYFTIYDRDFSEISKRHEQLRGQHMPSTVLGVTNPYFLKALEFWPNVISLGGVVPAKRGLQQQRKSAPVSKHPSQDRLALYPDSESDTEQTSMRTSKYEPTIAKRSASLHALLSDQKYETAMIITRDEPLIPPDKAVLKQLRIHKATTESRAAAAAAADAGVAWEAPAMLANNKVLREHFQQLTQAFLRPLERYFKLESVGSRAAQKEGLSLSAYNHPVSLSMEHFNIDSFMQSLEVQLPPKPLRRGDWHQLYRRFINGPNFLPWFRSKQVELDRKLSFIYRQLRLHTDNATLLKSATCEGKLSDASSTEEIRGSRGSVGSGRNADMDDRSNICGFANELWEAKSKKLPQKIEADRL